MWHLGISPVSCHESRTHKLRTGNSRANSSIRPVPVFQTSALQKRFRPSLQFVSTAHPHHLPPQTAIANLPSVLSLQPTLHRKGSCKDPRSMQMPMQRSMQRSKVHAKAHAKVHAKAHAKEPSSSAQKQECRQTLIRKLTPLPHFQA